MLLSFQVEDFTVDGVIFIAVMEKIENNLIFRDCTITESCFMLNILRARVFSSLFIVNVAELWEFFFIESFKRFAILNKHTVRYITKYTYIFMHILSRR